MSNATRIWCLVVTVWMASPDAGEAQRDVLAALLRRATAYVDLLHEQLLGVVMEERYQQRASTRIPGGRFGDDRYERRTLRSDYLLVQPPGTRRHFGFRDVFEVNGRPVRDREERLTRLFLTPSTSTDRQIQGILTDSARHNIGDVERNINTPTLALLVLRSDYKPRFEFRRVDDESLPLGLDPPDQPPDTWVVEYTETWPTTVVTGRNGENLPAHGRVWIGRETGRVWATEIAFENPELNATIAVRYDVDGELGHAVPVEMRERYRTGGGNRVDGTATYGRFRRFRVLVEETAPPHD